MAVALLFGCLAFSLGSAARSTGIAVHMNDRCRFTLHVHLCSRGGLALFLAPIRALRIGAIAHDAEIMLSVLEIGLCRNPVPGRLRVACQSQVLFVNLPGISPHPPVGPIAVKGMGPGRPTAMLFSIGPAAWSTAIIRTLSHRPLASIEFLAARARLTPEGKLLRAVNHTQSVLGGCRVSRDAGASWLGTIKVETFACLSNTFLP